MRNTVIAVLLSISALIYAESVRGGVLGAGANAFIPDWSVYNTFLTNSGYNSLPGIPFGPCFTLGVINQNIYLGAGLNIQSSVQTAGPVNKITVNGNFWSVRLGYTADISSNMIVIPTIGAGNYWQQLRIEPTAAPAGDFTNYLASPGSTALFESSSFMLSASIMVLFPIWQAQLGLELGYNYIFDPTLRLRETPIPGSPNPGQHMIYANVGIYAASFSRMNEPARK